MEERPVLVIIPGWGGTKETWRAFIEIARQNYDVHCIDLPCFGSEPCPKEIWGVEQYADFVKSKIINHKSKIILMGHSFGGAVAVQLVAKHPELVSKLILSGAAVIRQSVTIKRKAFGAVARIGRFVFEIPPLSLFKNVARRVLYKAADSLDYLNTSGIQREIYKKIIREDLEYLLLKITIPTLVVWGDHDTYVPLTYGKRIACLIPGANLRIVKAGKHGLHLQDPAGLYRIIHEYVVSH